MAAGLGFKTFTSGEVLTAADTNGYLMQGILVFANASARSAAITSPQEGQYSYLKDTNSTEYYDGAAWIAAPVGDITGVTAGTGISGGGTSGTVTITNSMATEITASGDIIVGTGSGTFDNLPIGTTGQILTADTTVSPYKVKWATSASSGFTLINSTNFSGAASFSIDSVFSSTYAYYRIICTNTTGSGSPAEVRINFRTGGVTNSSAAYYYGGQARLYASATSDFSNAAATTNAFVWRTNGATWSGNLDIYNPFASERTWFNGIKCDTSEAGTVGGFFDNTTSFDGFAITSTGANIAGNCRVYGYVN